MKNTLQEMLKDYKAPKSPVPTHLKSIWIRIHENKDNKYKEGYIPPNKLVRMNAPSEEDMLKARIRGCEYNIEFYEKEGITDEDDRISYEQSKSDLKILKAQLEALNF